MLEGQGHRGGRKSSWPAGLAQCSNGAESGTMKTGGFRGGRPGREACQTFLKVEIDFYGIICMLLKFTYICAKIPKTDKEPAKGRQMSSLKSMDKKRVT